MNSYRGGGQRRGSGMSRRGSRQPSNLHSLPFEQGVICSLRDSFGFIHCAERPDEVFFHYSEVVNCHPDDLQIDTEVEFKVAASNEGKLAAYAVHQLDPGTVVWEVEETEGAFYQGIVEKPSLPPKRDSRGSSGAQTDGTIRIVETKESQNHPSGEQSEDADETTENDSKNSNSKKNKKGPLVRLRAGEYTGAKVDDSNSRDSSNRLFRGDLVQFRVFLQKRTKQKYARQITLLQSDRERKRIEREKKLLESASQEEGIVVSLNNGFGFIKSNRRREDVYFHYSHLIIPELDEDGNDNDDFELKKGQEVKFLVIEETSNGGGRSKDKISARQIECLPKGSVVFRTVELKGVKGIVTSTPHPPSPGSRNDDSKWGRVRLVEQNEDQKDILFHFSDAPGGVFTYQNHRNQSMSAVWVHEGDTLLFDVAKETVDGSLRAIPTLHKIGLGGSVVEPDTDDNQEELPALKLISLSIAGRAEGVVHTLKPDFGFIHYAERPIDVHFKTYDFLPDKLQDDIRRNMGIDEPCRLEEGAAVRFDISAHGNITHTALRGRRRGAQQARENIRGQRIVLLPKSAVSLEKIILTGVKGVIKSTNPKELYSGVVELEEEAKSMTMDERHPIVAKFISSFLEESSLPNGRKSIVFPDTLGMNDDDVITEMARIKGEGLLECSHIPVPGIAPHPGRICIRRIEKEENAVDEEVKDETNEEAPKEAPKKGRRGRKKGKGDNDGTKNIRFDKSSLEEALKNDVPPSAGDIITCDVVQSRRTGKISIRNLKIIERTTVEITPAEGNESGVGVVKDVVPRRHFGFISVYDENNTKSEMLFFHLPKDKRFAKGNEVKFDIAMEGSKRIAINVESVRKGTIPSAASKNACLGYILMEPSHTTLSNTPVRKTAKAGGDKIGNGRWADANDDVKTIKQEMVEDGCILLLEDKTGMFQKKRVRRRKKRSDSVDSVDSSGDVSLDGATSVASDDGLSSDDGMTSDDGEGNGIVSILSRLNYKNGSIAIHGTGVASSMDGSTNPKRGDLVSFIKGRKARTARDIRIVKRESALLQRGRLENISVVQNEDNNNKGTAQFVAATEKQEIYDIDLAEVVSCSVSILKEKESVEGILHEGKIYGLCRTSDLYLKSKLFAGSGKNRERPKLNLTVKKNRGGTIMAQSMMAKGPDGTIGFATGWTSRVSQYSIINDVDESQSETNDEEMENAEDDAMEGVEQIEIVPEGGN